MVAVQALHRSIEQGRLPSWRTTVLALLILSITYSWLNVVHRVVDAIVPDKGPEHSLFDATLNALVITVTAILILQFVQKPTPQK